MPIARKGMGGRWSGCEVKEQGTDTGRTIVPLSQEASETIQFVQRNRGKETVDQKIGGRSSWKRNFADLEYSPPRNPNGIV